MSVCDRKKLYDTEFEANRAAAITETRWGEAMMSYPCGKHWHIAHVEQRLRNKHIKEAK